MPRWVSSDLHDSAAISRRLHEFRSLSSILGRIGDAIREARQVAPFSKRSQHRAGIELVKDASSDL